mmetsp:Transcript_98632/g.262142  ORF Transcript_98632/g.262142 Transcript_98632/m.262142 type:complete len:209 (-) Transcript_98632:406-1032(-)
MVVVAVDPRNMVILAMLCEVKVGVETHVRHEAVRVRACQVHAGCVGRVVDAATSEARHRHDVRALPPRDGRALLDAPEDVQVLAARHHVLRVEPRGVRQDPREEGEVVARGLVLEAHEVAPEDQQPPLLHRELHGVPLQFLSRVEHELAACRVDHVEETEPPPPDEVQVLLHEAVVLDVAVRQRLWRERVLLARAGERQPDHAVGAAC